MNPKRRRWLTVVAAVGIAGVTFLGLRDKDSTINAPTIELTQVWQKDGKQWASFNVRAPGTFPVEVKYQRIRLTRSDRFWDSSGAATSRPPVNLKAGSLADSLIQDTTQVVLDHQRRTQQALNDVLPDLFGAFANRPPVTLKAGALRNIQIQAPARGVWHVEFYFVEDMRGFRLWLKRLQLVWRLKTLNVWAATPHQGRWALSSEPITNAVPEAP